MQLLCPASVGEADMDEPEGADCRANGRGVQRLLRRDHGDAVTLCGRADWVCGSAGGADGGRGRQQGLVLVFYLFFDFFSGEFYGRCLFCVFTDFVLFSCIFYAAFSAEFYVFTY